MSFEYEETHIIDYVSSGTTVDIGYEYNHGWGYGLDPSISSSELSALMRPTLMENLKDQLPAILDEEDVVDWDSLEIEIIGMDYDPEDGLMELLFAWSARITKGQKNEAV